MRFLLDEDVNPRVAEIGRNFGLDVLSVHDIGRRGFGDHEQLAYAASQQRVFVTRNRDDFITLTVDAFRVGEPHASVLIVPYSLPNRQAELIATALRSWTGERPKNAEPFAYGIDFLGHP